MPQEEEDHLREQVASEARALLVEHLQEMARPESATGELQVRPPAVELPALADQEPGQLAEAPPAVAPPAEAPPVPQEEPTWEPPAVAPPAA